MKKLTIILGIIILCLTATAIFAQNPPHPNNGGVPGGGNSPVGGGAPIDGGLTIMLALGAAYGGKKLIAKYDEDQAKN